MFLAQTFLPSVQVASVPDKILENQNPSKRTPGSKNNQGIKKVLENLVHTIELVHFNSDYPENQTVRKTNKKNNLIEFRTGDDKWTYESCDTGIPKLQEQLELNLNTKFPNTPKQTEIRDIMYMNTKRGPIEPNDLLCMYDTTKSPEELCRNECNTIVKEWEVEYPCQKARKMPVARKFITKLVNDVRLKYDLPLYQMTDMYINGIIEGT